MRVLVTGGAGFIGRNIIDTCSKNGWETASLDLLSAENADISYKGSILDKEILGKALKDVDLIFHEAAVTSPPQFDQNDTDAFEVNAIGTLRLLQSAIEHGVERAVLASSSAVYGDLTVPGREDMQKPVYTNLYPLSKSLNEESAAYFWKRNMIETVCLRYFNTYGNGENTKGQYSSVISKFLDYIDHNETPVIYGDGSQSRDFIYVKDVAEANVLSAKKSKPGEIYNVGTGVTTTFNDIYRTVQEETGTKLDAEYEPVPFESYQLFTQADTGKISRELGFKPKYDLASGIRDMLNLRNSL